MLSLFRHLPTTDRLEAMNNLRMVLALSILFVLAIVGCQTPIRPIENQRMTMTGDQHAVPLNSDEKTFLDASHDTPWWELSVI